MEQFPRERDKVRLVGDLGVGVFKVEIDISTRSAGKSDLEFKRDCDLHPTICLYLGTEVKISGND